MHGKQEQPPRTPTDVKFRSAGSKFLPNHMDAILHENSLKNDAEHSSDSDGGRKVKDAVEYYKDSLNPRNALNFMY
jgi:hypothetical protein